VRLSAAFGRWPWIPQYLELMKILLDLLKGLGYFIHTIGIPIVPFLGEFETIKVKISSELIFCCIFQLA
jgi:replication fork clamp-binding protein CrfC